MDSLMTDVLDISYDDFLDFCLDDENEHIEDDDSENHSQMTTSTSPNIDDENTIMSRTKIKRSRRISDIPRLFKCDIRRSYAAMYANVLNSLNVDVMTSFLDKFFVPNFKSNYTFLQPVDTDKPQSVDTLGFASFMNMWYIGSMSSPDIVYMVQDSTTQVRVKSDNTSVVVCSFSVKGSKVYVTPPPIELVGGAFDRMVAKKSRVLRRQQQQNQQAAKRARLAVTTGVNSAGATEELVLLAKTNSSKIRSESVVDTSSNSSGENSESNNISGGKQHSSNKSSSFVDDIQSTTISAFLPRPYTLTIAGTLTMHVDVNKRVHSMEFVATPTISKLDLSDQGL